MKYFIFGSTQYVYVRDIYEENGHKVYINSFHKVKPLRWVINFYRIIKSDTIYHIGGCYYKNNIYLKFGHACKKKIIIHWIGTDVQIQTQKYKENGIIINEDCVNLAVAEHLCSELEKIGIKADYVPIVPRIRSQTITIPLEHKVLVYLPIKRQKFYGYEVMKILAAEFPNIIFHVVANDGSQDNDRLENVIYDGMLSKKQLYSLYEECSILLRYPEHDGLPVMIIEALSMGKTVIYKYPFAYTVNPEFDTKDSIIKCFRGVIDDYPKVNYDAINYIKETFSFEKIAMRYKELNLI